MTTQTEMNKFLAGKMKVVWGECGAESNTVHYDVKNPDYFTASGRQRLLVWAVGKLWIWDFIAKYEHPVALDKEPDSASRTCREIMGVTAGLKDYPDIPTSLFIPESRLAEEVYTYLKGRNEET